MGSKKYERLIPMYRLTNKLIMFVITLLVFIGCALSGYACDFNCENGISTDCYMCIYDEWGEDLKEYTSEVCEENDIPYELVLAIIYNESRFQSEATGYNKNGTKDYGLMQLNDITYDFLNENIGILR